MSLFRFFLGPPAPRERLEGKIDTLIQEFKNMSSKLQDLQQAVSQNKDAVASAVALIHGFADQAEAAKGDDAAMDALIADIRSQATSLGQAVVQGTPQGSASAQAVQGAQTAAAAATPSNAPPAPAGAEQQLGNTGATPGAAQATATVPDASTGKNNTPTDPGTET